ncbi:enoyl-CoA hydratase/isomerase family protein [Shouchella clausii]|uniref:enoyl-CoA hydratase/isomerase family protein n=1 Tax=Shouchella clausii TaxID=79880 RepID=UPI0007937D69|nr:enoyl-CoA hydratase [Shouchella clausii]KKI85202.1 enoyl-CoA hydratase [Shouchella clausii]
MSDFIKTYVEDGVQVIILNRPNKKNAFNKEMIEQWSKCLKEAKEEERIRVILLTGAGDAFCAGGDVGGMNAHQTPLDNKNKLWESIHKIPLTLKDMDKPVIAAINGPAVGAGLDMALMCDLRFIKKATKISEGYVKVGLVPGDGGAYFLPKIVGESKALELLWTGEFIDSEEALRIGLVNKVLEEDRFFEEVLNYAKNIASGPQIAIRMTKRAVKYSNTMRVEEALDFISSQYAIIKETNDHIEGVSAFKEKRKPNFNGN